MQIANSLLWQLGRIYLSLARDHRVITVVEYPKGGGTWVGKLLATCLDIPFVGGGKYLPLIPSVIRTHWPVSPRIKPCVVIVRDPRDVMVSLFFHRIRNMGNTPGRKKQFEKIFPGGLSADHISSQLSKFIELEFDDPRYGAHINWSEFVDSAIKEINDEDGMDSIVLVKYEDMISRPVDTLSSTLSCFGFDLSVDLISQSVKIHDKSWGNKNFIGNPGETTYVRSGQIGEWRQVFNQESGKTLSRYCGARLVSLGYAENLEWWSELD